MRRVIILLSFFVMTSCVLNHQDKVQNRVEYIRNLSDSLGFIELPFSYDIMKDYDKEYFKILKNSNDTLIFPWGYGRMIGILPDTSDYYGFLYLDMGEYQYPSLRIFNKTGTLIEEKNICIGYGNGSEAGGKMEYDTCYDRVTINKDLSLLMEYKLYGYIESQGRNPIPRSDTIYQEMTWNGQINEDGKIIINESVLKRHK